MRSAGKTGLMSRIFGSANTEEVREMKVNLLEQKIQEGKISVYSAQKDLKYVEILVCFLFLRIESRLMRSVYCLFGYRSMQTVVKLGYFDEKPTVCQLLLLFYLIEPHHVLGISMPIFGSLPLRC